MWLVCPFVTAANSKVHNYSIQLLLNFFDSCADSGQPTKSLYFPYQELYCIDLTYIYSTVHVYFYVKTKIERNRMDTIVFLFVITIPVSLALSVRSSNITLTMFLSAIKVMAFEVVVDLQ